MILSIYNHKKIMLKKIFASMCILTSLLSGCNNNKFVDTSPMHKPYLNPGGIDFERDTEFFKSYNKLEGERKKRCETSYRPSNATQIIENQEQKELPGYILIGEQESRVLGKNDLNRMIAKISGKKDQQWFKDNCVENKELPDELKDLVSSKCETISNDANINSHSSVAIIESGKENSDIPKAVEYSNLLNKSTNINDKKTEHLSNKKQKYIKIDLCKQNDYEILSIDNIVNNCDKYSDKLGAKKKISYNKNLTPVKKKKVQSTGTSSFKKEKIKIQNLDLG